MAEVVIYDGDYKFERKKRQGETGIITSQIWYDLNGESK